MLQKIIWINSLRRMSKRVMLICFSSIISLFIGCDPSDSLEANIVNKTSQDFSIEFVSSDFSEINSSLLVKGNETETYSYIDKVGTRTNLLYFNDFDSIYIQNSSNEILKLYKASTPGKNIYNVDEYWSVREPSKNHFVYTYEITEEDLE